MCVGGDEKGQGSGLSKPLRTPERRGRVVCEQTLVSPEGQSHTEGSWDQNGDRLGCSE